MYISEVTDMKQLCKMCSYYQHNTCNNDSELCVEGSCFADKKESIYCEVLIDDVENDIHIVIRGGKLSEYPLKELGKAIFDEVCKYMREFM